jgi:hypothetical protein
VELVEHGYSAALGVYITGKVELPLVQDLKVAVNHLMAPIEQYEFAAANDKSRYIAALLTPAFKRGKFIQGHVPLTIYEADQSQAGKTELAKTVPAAYGEGPATIARREGGVGSVDESICQALIHGHSNILLDNWRGDLDSTFLESALTAGGKFSARALRTSLDVEANQYFFAISSSGMNTTPDLCNRALFVRIKKRTGYAFPIHAEGLLSDHVLAHFPSMLSSIYWVIAEWIAAGRPRTDGAGHSFVGWSGIMDWIVQNFFGLPALLDGHAAVTQRTSEPSLAILRLVCLQVDKSKLLDKALQVATLADLATENGIDIGGYDPNELTGPAKVMGKILVNSFRAMDPTGQIDAQIQLEGFYIRRQKITRKR